MKDKTELVTLSGMRVKTDITVYSGGCIRFGSHIVQSLGMHEGDGVELVRYGVELMLCVVRKPDTKKYGNLLVRSSRGGRTMQLHNKAMASVILGEYKYGKYRCGELMEINGRTYAPIITRRNYGIEADTT